MFTVDWEFEHETSSPLYPKSNGKDEKDLWLALHNQRNTPAEGLGSSLAQRLISRRTIGLLPTVTTLPKPKVEGVRDTIKLRKLNTKHYHDCTAKTLQYQNWTSDKSKGCTDHQVQVVEYGQVHRETL